MIEGYVDEITREIAVGWAIDAIATDHKVPVVIIVNGRERGKCSAELHRKHFRHSARPGQVGADCGFMFRFVPPLSVFEQHHVEVRFADSGSVVPNGQRFLPAPSPGELPLKPILVTARGRSGTTLLMNRFLRHPEIVVADVYPFEIKLASYYVSAFKVLTLTKHPEDREPDFIELAMQKLLLGRNPFNAPGLSRLVGTEDTKAVFDELIPNNLYFLFREAIKRYYATVAEKNKVSHPRFFAEKSELDSDLRRGHRMLLGDVREIVLLRDPRDLLCSAKSFWKMDSRTAFRTVVESVAALQEIYAAQQSDTLLVRYEDIISDESTTMSAIYRFIGAEAQDQTDVAALDALQRVHATSASPAASIGRWQRDLSSDEIYACLDVFEPFMRTFGYLGGDVLPSPGVLRVQPTSEPRGPGASAPASAQDGFMLAPQYATGTLGADGPRETLYANDAAHLPGALLATATAVLRVDFSRHGNGDSYATGGWAAPEKQFRWSSGPACEIDIPTPERPGGYVLEIYARPFVRKESLPSQEVVVSLNAKEIGRAVGHRPLVLRCGVDWDAFDGRETASFGFGFPSATRPNSLDAAAKDDRLLGWAFEKLTLIGPVLIPHDAKPAQPARADEHTAPREGSGADANGSFAPLLTRFESLGENCEFGLVQRRGGIEPLGLLRFSSTPLPPLLRALRARFEGMGTPETIEVEVAASGREYMIFDRRFGFRYHAWVKLGEMEPAAIHAREVRRLPFLVRKLIEDLTEGEKIFVFHGMQPLAEAQARELAAAIRGYGPGTLLWVELADAAHPPGSVVQLAPGLLKGHMDRFAPGENAHDLSLDCWIGLCRNAEALARARQAA